MIEPWVLLALIGAVGVGSAVLGWTGHASYVHIRQLRADIATERIDAARERGREAHARGVAPVSPMPMPVSGELVETIRVAGLEFGPRGAGLPDLLVVPAVVWNNGAETVAADFPPPAATPGLSVAAESAWYEAEIADAVAYQRAVLDAAPARRTAELVEASSLGTEVAAELRSGVTPAGELTGVVVEQADWDEGGEPPTDPYDVEPTPSDAEEGLPRDETRVLAYGDWGDGPPGGESPMQAQGYRFAWAHLRGEELPEPGPWRPPMAWMVQAPIRMQRRYSRLRVWLTGTAGKLAEAASWKPGDLATLTGVDMVLPSERLLQGPGIHRKPRWWQRKPASEGRHRPEVVARTTRAVRTLRDDWRAVLTAPRRTPIVPFPGRCIP